MARGVQYLAITGQSLMEDGFRGNQRKILHEEEGRFATAVQTTRQGQAIYQSGQGQHQNAGVQPQSGQSRAKTKSE